MSGRLGNYLELVREAQKKRLQITSNQKKQIAELFRQSAKDFEREAGKKKRKKPYIPMAERLRQKPA